MPAWWGRFIMAAVVNFERGDGCPEVTQNVHPCLCLSLQTPVGFWCRREGSNTSLKSDFRIKNKIERNYLLSAEFVLFCTVP